MPILGLSHYNLRAPRATMDALRAFYVDVVGLAVGPRPPFRSDGYWLHAGGRAVLHLSLTGPDEPPPADARTTFDHVAFDCRDRATVEANLAHHGIAFRRAVVPATSQVQLFFADPAGNGVELVFGEADADPRRRSNFAR